MQSYNSHCVTLTCKSHSKPEIKVQSISHGATDPGHQSHAPIPQGIWKIVPGKKLSGALLLKKKSQRQKQLANCPAIRSTRLCSPGAGDRERGLGPLSGQLRARGWRDSALLHQQRRQRRPRGPPPPRVGPAFLPRSILNLRPAPRGRSARRAPY